MHLQNDLRILRVLYASKKETRVNRTRDAKLVRILSSILTSERADGAEGEWVWVGGDSVV